MTVFKTGDDSSTIIFCPLGTKTVSPSLGADSPPHVISSLHKSPYMNLALFEINPSNPNFLIDILA